MTSVARICEEESEPCDNLASSRGLCTRHYDRRKRRGTLPPLKRVLREGAGSCVRPDCNRPQYNIRLGLCATHYNRHLRGIRMDLPVRKWGVKSCKVEGCERPHSHFGFCELHAKRDKKGADLLAPVRKPTGITECTLPNCERPHDGKGLCGNHAYTERKYNLSREQTLALHLGVCDVCGERDEDRELAVDHDHGCCPGKESCGNCVRGFLCSPCNLALGLMQDDPDRLRTAASYIEKSISASV